MRNTPTRDTPAELAIRRILHGGGLRYRVDYPPDPRLRRKADIVFTRSKVAVFVDGCFWHDCSMHGASPKANADWWREKLATNVQRDRNTDERLRAAGWTVIRVWEHERPLSAVELIVRTLEEKRGVMLSKAEGKRVSRAGVRFDCVECGRLLRDDDDHSERLAKACPRCGGELRLVGKGERMVDFAKWYRCQACAGLSMVRRGEIVPTKPRAGFSQFA